MADLTQNPAEPQPLNDACLGTPPGFSFPPDDAPVLAPYASTRPGYELLTISAGDGRLHDFFPAVAEGVYEVCLWDIWHNGDDPAASDPVKQKLNSLQRAAAPLDDETRFIRLQIACFNRCWFTFPDNVELILRGIGNGQVDLRDHVSCEPPWFDFVQILRRRRSHPSPLSGRYRLAADGYPDLSPRQSLARAYINILTWWTHGGDLACLKLESPQDADRAETIYRRLGPPDRLKTLYVQKLRTALGHEAFPNHRSGLGWFMELLDQAIEKELGDRQNVAGPLIEERNLCHHNFFRWADHQIAAIGAGRWVPLPEAGQERKRVHEAVTNYVHAIGSWMARREVCAADEIWPAGAQVTQRVYSLLGRQSPAKRWLVACLWEKLQANQAHHGRGALDSQPERFSLPESAWSAA